MNSLLKLGKFLYAVPMAIFGLMHFVGAKEMAPMVPIPGGAIWVYLTGIALLAAAVGILIGKWDKLAALLLGVLLLIFALSIHLPNLIGGDQMSMGQLLKDLALAGGAWMYGIAMAKDSTGVK